MAFCSAWHLLPLFELHHKIDLKREKYSAGIKIQEAIKTLGENYEKELLTIFSAEELCYYEHYTLHIANDELSHPRIMKICDIIDDAVFYGGPCLPYLTCIIFLGVIIYLLLK
jgi:hypothetical protein